MLSAVQNPSQVKYELDSYNYYFQQELDATPFPNFPIAKKIHAVYPIFGKKYDLFKRTSEGLHRIFEKVCEERHRELNAGEDTFHFTEIEQRLARVHPKNMPLIRHLRFDAIYSPSHHDLKILECNPENPGGLWDNDFAVSCMARNMSKLYQGIFAPDGDFSKINHRKQHEHALHSIVSAHEAMYGYPPVTIAIGVFPDDDGYFVGECQANYFRSQGYNVVMVDPCELRYWEGKVYAPDNTPVDVLFRSFVLSETRDYAHGLEYFCRAYENHDLCVVPPMSDSLVTSKTLIAEIPTRYRHLLTEEDIRMKPSNHHTIILMDEFPLKLSMWSSEI
ncbi:MAG: hypothetical protein B6242_06580 [Anaerolineaceae bacterium 4572_78]|nr:MAG: hypothetical protein B6242_06580 [Anaerolineaceae bacterium 4572_78]